MFSFLDDMVGAQDVPPPEPPHLDCLQDILSKKYTLLLAYVHYGDQLRAYFRDGVYEHFQEHIKEERAQIYALNKKITALGGDAEVSPEKVPNAPLADASAVFHLLLKMELEVVAKWSELFHATPDDVPLNALAQEGALIDQQHADDMRRYLRSGS